MEFIYEPIKRSDIEEIYFLLEEQVYRYETDFDMHEDLIMDLLIGEILKNIYGYKSVFRKGVKIAYISLEFKEANIYLSDFFLIKEYRAKGLGRKILEDLIELAINLKADISLDLYRENRSAYNLYYSMGFRTYKKEENKKISMIRKLDFKNS